MTSKLCLIALPALFTGLVAVSSATHRAPGERPAPAVNEPPGIYHPHFRKVLECRISRDLILTIRYQTVTFDAEGAKKMVPGQAWHLAGATLETSSDVVIGGQQVAAGQYALSVVKAAGEKWQLTLHKGRGFSRPTKAAQAQVLKTRFQQGAPLFEHMCIDVQPAGDKDHTRLHLDVRFDTLLASATIEIPEQKKKK